MTTTFRPPALGRQTYEREARDIEGAFREAATEIDRPRALPIYHTANVPPPGETPLAIITTGSPAGSPRLAFAWGGAWYYADDSSAV